VLAKDAPLTLWAIVDEAALHRVVGGTEVMRVQFGHLAEVMKPRTSPSRSYPLERALIPGCRVHSC